MFIFYRLFSNFFFFLKNNLSHIVHSSYKYYLLLTYEKNIFFRSFSLSHNKLSHFFSSFFFSFFSHPHYHRLWPLLFSQISLSICLSSLFSPYFFPPLTLFFNKVFFLKLFIYLYIYIYIDYIRWVYTIHILYMF